MKTLNVIGFKVAGVMCAGLLLACADGRGTNGFKSYQYSKTEKEQNLALKAKRDGTDKVQPRNTPGADDSQETGAINLGTSAPPAPVNRPDSPPVFTSNDSAAGKNFTEPQTPPASTQVSPAPNPSAVADLSAKVQDLNVTIENELKQGAGENKIAKALIKGITILPKGTDADRKFDLRAIVRINGEEAYMEANDTAVKFLKAEERMQNFLFTLSKPCEEGKVIQVKNSLQAAAKCRDAACLVIEVILSFETQNENRRANAILVVAPTKNAQDKVEWSYLQTNIGTPKTFEQEGPHCAKPELPVTAAPPAAPAVEPAPTAPQAPAQPSAEETARLEKERAERQAADNKWCEDMKKEGFSCDDSPGEIARMRNARKAAEAASQAGTQAQSPVATSPVCPETGINPSTHGFCIPGSQISGGVQTSELGNICSGANCTSGVPFFVNQRQMTPARGPRRADGVQQC
jgi:hypothetical protein